MIRHAILVCVLLAACATAPDVRPGADAVMRDRSDDADRWNRDQCMDGHRDACDELRRSTAAKR